MNRHELQTTPRAPLRADPGPRPTPVAVRVPAADEAGEPAARALFGQAIRGLPGVSQPPAPLRRQAILALHRTIGNAAVGRLLTDSARRTDEDPPSPVARPDVPIQRFGGKEHRNIGDWVTNRKYVTLGTKGYRLSYGELIALAGDLFPSLAYMEELANRPGPGPKTQEALDYARFIKIGRRERSDARTQSQVVDDDTEGDAPDESRRYDPETYSKETRKAVDGMYYQLATDNARHFVTPSAADAGKEGQDRPHSAGASYREYHEEALRRACLAGKQGASGHPALAAEGFGGHFLTDAVSAGHLRTPRLDIVAHWDKRDPGLADRFKGYMMTQVSEWILANRRKYTLAGPGVIYSVVADGIDKALAGRPALTLGILVALAIHDYDNKQGLQVLSGGKQAHIYGDHHLGQGDTEQVVRAVVKAGIDEVRHAYQLGQEGKTFDAIKATLLAGGTQYQPELLLPRLDPQAANQPMPKWAVETFEDLLADGLMREALALTISNNVAEIVAVAESMAEPGKSGVIKGFADVVRQDPIRALRAIYSYKGTPTFDFRNLGAMGVELPTH